MVLDLCNRADIPVSIGAAGPLIGEFSPALEVHGKSGMDGHSLQPSPREPSELSAVQLMEQVISMNTGPVTVIATGALTNIAVFLLANPVLRHKVDCISIMGGGCEEGNSTAVSEANIWKDPEACHVVFESGIPIELYGLNVTHQALILTEEFEKFRSSSNKVTRFVGELLDFFAIYYEGTGGLPGCPIHDACAVAGIVAPRLFDYEYMRMSVDLYGVYTRGAISFDLRTEPRRDYPYTGKAAICVRREEFVRLIFDACESFS